MKKHLPLIGTLTTGILILMMMTNSAYGQSTYSQVYNILQNNCTASGCHGSSNTQVFDVSGSQANVYNRLVGAACANTAAVEKGYKLVDPGYPYRSFLLKKVAHGISPELALDQSSEGVDEPRNSGKLADSDIELIRQWILFGASQTGSVVNVQTIADFYNGKGLPVITPSAAPAPEKGFQIHQGPIFLAPGEEREYLFKYETKLPQTLEVIRMQAHLSPQSHHLILYKYLAGTGNNEPNGLKLVDNLGDQASIFTNAYILATWQFDRDHELPPGTAYYWESNSILNINFHVKNYSTDSILAANAYINIYTQPSGSGATQMFSDLVVYGYDQFNPYALYVKNDGKDTTFRMVQTSPGETWYVWVMQAHTHKHGKDFDIFLRNPDGTKGDQVYEGYFNEDYSFNEGYFNYTHPAVREFSPMLQVDMNNGLIHEATYNNSGPAPVSFGLTTNDEMFITYMHYTKSLPTAVHEIKDVSVPMSIFPNPSNGQFVLSYELQETEQVKTELFSIVGERIALLSDELQVKGTYRKSIDSNTLGLMPGVYFIKLSSAKFSSAGKVVVE